MCNKFILVLFSLSFSISVFSQVSKPYKVDFENHQSGSYTLEMMQRDFPSADWYHGYEYDRASIVKENGNSVLRIKYPQGCVGPNYGEGCGIQIKWNLPEPSNRMWVQYRIKFEEGFDFRKGGKLPGLCGGKAYTGGNKPASKGDGWSARIMWRENGSIYQYMYYVEQIGNYGDYWEWKDEAATTSGFVPGRWHTVTTEIILNTVNAGVQTGNHDGSLRSWLDGQLVLEKNGLRLVDFDDQLIDWFYISTFHGGSSSDWAPLHDSYICYDDIVISKSPLISAPSSNAVPPPLNKMKAWVYHDRLYVSGLTEGATWSLYNLSGSLVFHDTAPGSDANIILPARGIYFVTSENQVVKVVY